MKPSHIALAVLVTLIWGANFVVLRLGVSTLPPLLLTALRFAVAAFPAVLLVARPRVDWRLVVAFGFVLGVVQFSLLTVGMARGMPAGLSSAVLQAQAFFTVALGVVLLGERLAWHQVLAMVLGAVGLALVALDHAQGGLPLVPLVMVIGAAAAWGVCNILTKRAGQIDMLGFVVWASLVPPLPVLALSLWLEGGAPQLISAVAALPWRGVAVLAYLGLLSTLVGYGLWTWLLRQYPASVVAPFSLLVPVTGVGFGWLVFDERLNGAEALGVALVVLALVVNTLGGRPLARWRRRRGSLPAPVTKPVTPITARAPVE